MTEKTEKLVTEAEMRKYVGEQLKAQAAKHSVEVQALSHRMVVHEKFIKRHEPLLKLISESAASKILKGVEKRLQELKERLELDILKLEVCTEVSRVYPKTWKLIVYALDMPDKWWDGGHRLTIAQWKDKLESMVIHERRGIVDDPPGYAAPPH